LRPFRTGAIGQKKTLDVDGAVRKLREHDGRTYWVATAAPTVSPFQGKSYPCLIWDHGLELPAAHRKRIADDLVRGGCRYAVCAGANAEQWHLVFDEAFLSAFGFDESDWGDNFVMTTGHEGESPEDVAHYFALNTNFDSHDFRDFLVLHIGESPMVQVIEAAVWKFAAPTAT
jgi:hypothetical protein